MTEPANPFYRLLLIVSFLFVVTCLAYALVPLPDQPRWLQTYGWQILLIEVGGIILFGLLSMALDRVRILQEQAQGGPRQQDQDHLEESEPRP